MQQAEQVTFGTGQLERAAFLREDPAALQDLLRQGPCILPLWHGKPLVQGSENKLEFISASHPILKLAREAPLFLGMRRPAGGAAAGQRPVFAVNVSTWTPPGESQARESQVFLDQTRQELAQSNGAFCELRMVMAALEPVEAEIAATARAMLSWHASHRFCAACGSASALSHGGWQRTCPACKSAHFPRTDPVVIMLITQGNSVLLGRSPGWPERMYSLLAGFMEPGESIEAAVRREVGEEVGVTVGRVDYLASQPWPYPSSLMIGCHGRATSRAITLDPVEMEDARWLSREQLAHVFAGQHPDISPPRVGAIAQFLLENWLADRLD